MAQDPGVRLAWEAAGLCVSVFYTTKIKRHRKIQACPETQHLLWKASLHQRDSATVTQPGGASLEAARAELAFISYQKLKGQPICIQKVERQKV